MAYFPSQKRGRPRARPRVQWVERQQTCRSYLIKIMDQLGVLDSLQTRGKDDLGNNEDGMNDSVTSNDNSRPNTPQASGDTDTGGRPLALLIRYLLEEIVTELKLSFPSVVPSHALNITNNDLNDEFDMSVNELP
ncbi:Uncharacterized protein APZ42_028421 [Daphnia magna]|uniref:Uncharacterized protein n=1 Tax=Daphnia magna TaxID=35525 RepID=A0A164QIG9_9CRUS|nr:Uncharacterized protein APZ42_028421 [Daphnia magna]